MKGIKTYVYGAYNSNDEIIYVGKSSCPKARMRWHHAHKRFSKCIILDIFQDTENYWIKKLKSEGANLQNKYEYPEEETWNIGDTIEVGNLRKLKIKNIKTGKIYKSLQELSNEIGVERNTLKYRIDSKTYKTPYTYV